MFFVKVKVGYEHHNYMVTLQIRNSTHEVYRVTRGGDHLVLKTNRPLIRGKGLKHKRPSWEQLSGNISYNNIIQDIIRGILAHVDG